MIKKILRRIKYGTTARIDMFRMHRQWRAIQARAYSSRKITSVRKLLIIPSDPWTLVGAKGDEAMMEAAVGPLRAREPGLVVGVVVATQVASDAARGLGFVPIPAWSGSLTDSIAQIEQFQPDGMVILGADIMDGYYGPSGPMRVLMIADTAARMGVRVSILGFSFNQHPSPRLKPVFDALHRDVAVTHERPAAASDYVALLKPRVMSLVVFTGLVGYVAAPGAGDNRRRYHPTQRQRTPPPNPGVCG